MLNGMVQKEKDNYWMLSFTCGIWKIYVNTEKNKGSDNARLQNFYFLTCHFSYPSGPISFSFILSQSYVFTLFSLLISKKIIVLKRNKILVLTILNCCFVALCTFRFLCIHHQQPSNSRTILSFLTKIVSLNINSSSYSPTPAPSNCCSTSTF